MAWLDARLSRRALRGGTLVAAASLLLCSRAAIRVAHAGDPLEPTSDDRKAASQSFHEGDRAYREGEYRHAAEAYEQAYRRVPERAPLWNEAHAWEKAGEPARAANAYAEYLRAAPTNAAGAARAAALLSTLAQKLGKIEVHPSQGVTGITVDGAALEGLATYVTPGTHLVVGHVGDDLERQSLRVEPGASVSVALEPQPAPPPPPPLPAPPPPPPDVMPLRPAPSPVAPPPAVATRSGRPLSPAVTYAGGAMTIAVAALALWSGLDTLDQKTTFEASRTQANLDAGREKELRTNALLGTAGALAAVTAVTAAFFVDWSGGSPAASKPPRDQVSLGLGLGTLTLRGAF
ncbi:MAG TPA: hypothetical protein VGI39_45715 [Polyangiaceae bacterium]|jgi:hypothetical protein